MSHGWQVAGVVFKIVVVSYQVVLPVDEIEHEENEREKQARPSVAFCLPRINTVPAFVPFQHWKPRHFRMATSVFFVNISTSTSTSTPTQPTAKARVGSIGGGDGGSSSSNSSSSTIRWFWWLKVATPRKVKVVVHVVVRVVETALSCPVVFFTAIIIAGAGAGASRCCFWHCQWNDQKLNQTQAKAADHVDVEGLEVGDFRQRRVFLFQRDHRQHRGDAERDPGRFGVAWQPERDPTDKLHQNTRQVGLDKVEENVTSKVNVHDKHRVVGEVVAIDAKRFRKSKADYVQVWLVGQNVAFKRDGIFSLELLLPFPIGSLRSSPAVDGVVGWHRQWFNQNRTTLVVEWEKAKVHRAPACRPQLHRHTNVPMGGDSNERVGFCYLLQIACLGIWKICVRLPNY